MKLLILGGTGFIGSSLKNYFISKSKMKILCPTRKELNLTDFEDCKNYLKENSPDIILHAAVELNSVENSVRMLFNFLDNSDKFGKLIYLGSGAEYNPKKYTQLMKEKKSVQSYPESGYYLSKYICGREIEAHKKKEIYNLSHSFTGVYKIERNTKFEYILKKTDIEDIWGVGRNIAKFFKNNKTTNAFDFMKINENFAKQEKGILIKKTILELRGISCYPLEIKGINRKSIRVSRSFGKKISSYEDLEASLIVYTQKATKKLRDHKLFCNSITVFLETSRYKDNYYKKSDTFLFLQAEMDSRKIWIKAKYLLNRIYLRNYLYNKIGIILSNFSRGDNIQNSLFDYYDENSMTLMRVFDGINKKFGEGKIRIASDKYGVFYKSKLKDYMKVNNWFMKSDFCSPCYTTRWCDIPKVKIK